MAGKCNIAEALTLVNPAHVLSAQAHVSAQHLPAGLGKLVSCWKEEALHLALEALNGVVGKDNEAAARWEPLITPPLLQIWAHNFSDPLVAMDTVDIFNSLASIPAALPALQVCPPPPLPRMWIDRGM